MNNKPDQAKKLNDQSLGMLDDRMIILVDIERLMTSREMELIEAAA